ncbi:MAG: hypothetical protein V3S77_08935 [Acidiferrobacterales bacterium]
MYAKRFPIPDFNHEEFKNMEWTPPAYLSQDQTNKLIERQKAGDTSVYGCYPVQASEELYAAFSVLGAHRHAVMCVMPDKEVKLLGRSYAWRIQRALVLDSLDPGVAKVLFSWKTPRPMNIKLGPTDGVSMDGGIVYAICGHAIGSNWVGNRTILQHNGQGSSTEHGLTILSSSEDDINDFHECNLYFRWS